ncbi:hypothetical protein [Hippea jasoniae]|nr:hypothetical protein [Hippea jasoniae]
MSILKLCKRHLIDLVRHILKLNRQMKTNTATLEIVQYNALNLQ